MRSRLVPCLLALAIANSPLLGQGGISVLTPDADYFTGRVGVKIPDSSSPPGTPSGVFALSGTARLNSNRSFTSASTGTAFLSNQQTMNLSDSGAGTYQVTDESVILIDNNPTQPGTDVERYRVNKDGTVAFATRTAVSDESFMSIAVQKSSGRSNASLAGSYHLVAVHFQFAPALETSTDVASFTFDGAGSFTGSGQKHHVLNNGTSSTTPASFAGSYSIAPDGALQVGSGGGPAGAISPDGSFFFLTEEDTGNSRVAMMVGIKIGAAYTMDQIAGRWAVIDHELALGTSPTNPECFTDDVSVEFTRSTASTGSYQGNETWVSNDPLGGSTGIDAFSGTVTVGTGGEFFLQDSLSPPPPMVFIVSEDGEYVLAGPLEDGLSALIVGTLVSDESSSFGTATPGTGGLAPELGMSGFPWIGNSSFALRVASARAGAPCLYILATQPSTGFPFLGGSLWLDPLYFITTFGTATSAQGEANMPLPIPPAPYLAGSMFHGQAFILDAGAPQGIAMTQGYTVVLSR
jgi:hypothetical protein